MFKRKTRRIVPLKKECLVCEQRETENKRILDHVDKELGKTEKLMTNEKSVRKLLEIRKDKTKTREQKTREWFVKEGVNEDLYDLVCSVLKTQKQVDLVVYMLNTDRVITVLELEINCFRTVLQNSDRQ